MEVESFDTKLFIDEVEKRRCIWDMECPEYKNRLLKKSAWQELVDIFAGENSTQEQKTALGNMLQKKWKHVRDNFSRELKKQKTLKSGSGASKTNPYIFFQRLMFLQPSMTNKNTTSNLESTSQLEEETEIDDVQLRSGCPSRSAVDQQRGMNFGSNKRFKMNPVDRQFIDILNRSVAIREQQQSEIPKEDDDKLFCLSLYKELQKVHEHARIRTKIQLLEVIQRAQDFYNPPHCHPSSQSYHSYPPQPQNQFDYGVNQQRNQRPARQQDSFSEHFGYNSQSAAAVDTPPSQIARAVLSPAGSSVSQANSEFSDLYN